MLYLCLCKQNTSDMRKVYIYRIVNHNGRKEYKRAKCLDYWASNKAVCWKFSVQGTKKIIATLNANNPYNYYTFGYEAVEL